MPAGTLSQSQRGVLTPRAARLCLKTYDEERSCTYSLRVIPRARKPTFHRI
jgi:hypothetical protein